MLTSIQEGSIGTEHVVGSTESAFKEGNLGWVMSFECISAGLPVLDFLIIFKDKIHILFWWKTKPNLVEVCKTCYWIALL